MPVLDDGLGEARVRAGCPGTGCFSLAKRHRRGAQAADHSKVSTGPIFPHQALCRECFIWVDIPGRGPARALFRGDGEPGPVTIKTLVACDAKTVMAGLSSRPSSTSRRHRRKKTTWAREQLDHGGMEQEPIARFSCMNDAGGSSLVRGPRLLPECRDGEKDAHFS